MLLDPPAFLLADYAAPGGEALGGMLVHPLGKLRRAHQAGLHRDLGEVRGGHELFVTIGRRGEAAENGNDLDHDSRLPSPLPAVDLSGFALAGSPGGKMLS